MNIDLSGKVAIVTGGSRGIGKEIVTAFAENGAIVYFTYLTNAARAKDLEKELNSRGHNVFSEKVDNCSLEHVNMFAKKVINEQKHIDILVNNAGYIPRGLFLKTSEIVWKKAIDTNLGGVYNYCSAILKYMILQKQGNIINISTVSALQPSPGQAAYSASKAAIESLTRTLAMEHGKYNIRVNSIAPGLIQTEIVKSISKDIKDAVLQKTPIGRFGTSEDIANAAMLLASDVSSYITGVQLLVTGGRHLF